LHGVTRRAILALAEDLDIPLEPRPCTLEEAPSADEGCMTASPLYVLPVTTIDEVPVAQAAPGAMAGNLRARFLDAARSNAI
jgi:D-alanine transaminase